jgi:hypothetical protein
VSTAVEFLILTAAAYRTWRLLAFDTILDIPRQHVQGAVRRFLECPWCAGFWITAAWLTPLYVDAQLPVWLRCALPWAGSLLVGLTARNLDP